MEKNYYMVNVCIGEKNGYSFMVCSANDLTDYGVIESCKEQGLFQCEEDAEDASIETDFIGQCDIMHFANYGCLYDLDIATNCATPNISQRKPMTVRDCMNVADSVKTPTDPYRIFCFHKGDFLFEEVDKLSLEQCEKMGLSWEHRIFVYRVNTLDEVSSYVNNRIDVSRYFIRIFKS